MKLEEEVARTRALTEADCKELGLNLESRLDWLQQCADVTDTIDFMELELILYLRKSRFGDLHRFWKAAKLQYEALYAAVDLFPKKKGEEN